MGARVLPSVALSHFYYIIRQMSTNIYIDGFNLYFCALKETPYKWLNLQTFCYILFPGINIGKIKYFSAKVKALPWDPSAPTRQDIYWRALRTIPNLEIIEGNFVSWPRYLPILPFVYDRNGHPKKIQVMRTEEKGSDVNLAAYLVYDNCIKEAEDSIVISNDSDLAQAIELVTSKLKRNVTIVNPNSTKNVHKDPAHCKAHRELQRVASRLVSSINDKVLINAQFPATLTDSQGTFSKSASW